MSFNLWLIRDSFVETFGPDSAGDWGFSDWVQLQQGD